LLSQTEILLPLSLGFAYPLEAGDFFQRFIQSIIVLTDYSLSIKGEERMKRPFLSLVHDAGRACGIQFTEIVPNAVYKVEKSGQSFLMNGVDLGLNTTSAASIANSKSLTYSVLSYARVPCVEHLFLLHPHSPYASEDVYEKATCFFETFGPHLVVKPDNGMQGNDVFKVESLAELHESTTHLFTKSLNVALSPYYEAKYEYRVVVLNGEAKLSFTKEKVHSWKHNLTGGHAKVIELDFLDNSCLNKLHQHAVEAANALQLTFCTVDVLHTKNGFKVLEVNASVFLSEYMKSSLLAKQRVYHLYKEAFNLMFSK
jgi:carbamoylphosphate synthase large subunit